MRVLEAFLQILMPVAEQVLDGMDGGLFLTLALFNRIDPVADDPLSFYSSLASFSQRKVRVFVQCQFTPLSG